MVRMRLACTTTRQRTPLIPPVVVCPLFLLSSCWDKITYGTTAPSKRFFSQDPYGGYMPYLWYLFNRLQDAQGTPRHKVDFLASVAKLHPPRPSMVFSPLFVVNLTSIAAILARIASDLGGSPVVGPSQFKVGIVLSFLVYSFFFGSLGAIEALILSYSLRPRCLFVIFVFLCLFGQAHRTLAKTRPRSHGPRGDLARPRRVSLGKPHLRQRSCQQAQLVWLLFHRA